MLAVYAAVKPAHIRAPATRIAAAMGTSINTLQQWQRDGVALSSPRKGEWPAHWRDLPSKGTPVTYLLFNEHGTCVYIGSSHSVRARFKTHHKDPKKPGLDAWEVIIHESMAEARQLEADLIYQHQPYYNIVGRKNRAWVR